MPAPHATSPVTASELSGLALLPGMIGRKTSTAAPPPRLLFVLVGAAENALALR